MSFSQDDDRQLAELGWEEWEIYNKKTNEEKEKCLEEKNHL